MKHTPGPWGVFQMEQAPAGLEIAPRQVVGIPVAQVYMLSRPREEATANANLIAASPDLLEACEAAITWIDRLRAGIDGSLTKQQQNAIAEQVYELGSRASALLRQAKAKAEGVK